MKATRFDQRIVNSAHLRIELFHSFRPANFMRYQAFSLTLTAALFMGSTASRGADSVLPADATKRFDEEYVTRRGEWITLLESLPHSYDTTTEMKLDDSVVTKFRHINRRSGGNYVYAHQILVAAPATSPYSRMGSFCFGRNSQYFFQLDSRNANWVITNFVQPSPSFDDSAQLVANPTAQLGIFKKPGDPKGKAAKAASPVGDRFDNLKDSPGFELLSVRDQDGQPESVCVEYRSNRLDLENGKTYRATNWVVFSTNRYWAMKEYHSEYDDADRSVVFHHTNTYRTDTPYPALKTSRTMRRVTLVSSKQVKTEETLSSHEMKFGDIPDIMFSLSSFGLPEPAGVEWRKERPLYHWLLLAAGVATLLSCCFYLLKHRSQKRRV
jgi:hypothetical protein